MKARSITLCGLFAALAAVGAFMKIPTPLVPMTLQLFFVTLSGYLLGSKLAALSMGVYLLLGLVGLPVFTGGGGIGYVLQPTFGYLLGFLAAAYVTGKLSQPPCTYRRRLVAGFAGMAILYLIGTAYLYAIRRFYLGTPMSVWNTVLYGCLVFLPGDSVCTLVAAWAAGRLPLGLYGTSAAK